MNTKYCSNCGNQIAAESSFCNFCGANQDAYITIKKSEAKNDKINFPDALKDYFKYLFSAKGCDTRREYWFSYVWMTLFSGFLYSLWLVSYFSFYDTFTGVKFLKFLGFVVSVGLYFISISMIFSMCRRLHDANISGFFLLFLLVPIFGWILILILLCQRSSEEGKRKYGPKQKPSINSLLVWWTVVAFFGLLAGSSEMNKLESNYEEVVRQEQLDDEVQKEKEDSQDENDDYDTYDNDDSYDSGDNYYHNDYRYDDDY
ncbi:DUF805 domain-containing protein [Lactobacillus kunkeei]|nr:DUF805 domain-containing protein [Apilactobacillus kunkeei]